MEGACYLLDSTVHRSYDGIVYMQQGSANVKTHAIGFAVLVILMSVASTGCEPQQTTTTMRTRAHDAMWQGRWDDAEALYTELAKRYPQDWRVQFGLGSSAMHTNDLSLARQSLEIAHTLRPQNREIALELAEVMYLQDDRNGLFQFLRDRAEARNDSRDWLLLAEYSLMTDDPDSARTCLDQAVVVDDASSSEIYIEAATLSERMGDLDSAIQYLNTAYTIEPSNTNVQERLRAFGVVPGPTLAMPTNDPA